MNARGHIRKRGDRWEAVVELPEGGRKVTRSSEIGWEGAA